MLEDAKFGAASSKVVIEEFLKGIECSVFVLSDGENYKDCLLQRIINVLQGDKGLNTVGSISPSLC